MSLVHSHHDEVLTLEYSCGANVIYRMIILRRSPVMMIHYRFHPPFSQRAAHYLKIFSELEMMCPDGGAGCGSDPRTSLAIKCI